MVRKLILALVPAALLDSPSYHDSGRQMAIKPLHILVAFGIVLVILGHLGDGTAFQEPVLPSSSSCLPRAAASRSC
jgi:hypothetical protein